MHEELVFALTLTSSTALIARIYSRAASISSLLYSCEDCDIFHLLDNTRKDGVDDSRFAFMLSISCDFVNRGDLNICSFGLISCVFVKDVSHASLLVCSLSTASCMC